LSLDAFGGATPDQNLRRQMRRNLSEWAPQDANADHDARPWCSRLSLALLTKPDGVAVFWPRKHAEEALRQREVELGEAQRLAHIGSWYWKAEGDVLVALRRTAAHLPALSRDTARAHPARSAWSLVSHDERKRLKAAVQRSMRAGVGCELELQAFRNELPIWITVRGAAVCNSKTQIIGLRELSKTSPSAGRLNSH
jgi:hypothetical protein